MLSSFPVQTMGTAVYMAPEIITKQGYEKLIDEFPILTCASDFSGLSWVEEHNDQRPGSG